MISCMMLDTCDFPMINPESLSWLMGACQTNINLHMKTISFMHDEGP